MLYAKTQRELIRLTLLVLLIAVAGCHGPRTAEQADQGYAFWPQYPDEPRIQFLVSYRYSRDVEPKASGLEDLIYGGVDEVLPIQKPYGVEMWEGKIYVCDIRNACVSILDLRKNQMRVMGTSGLNSMGRPVDIAIASDGMKYIADIAQNVIFVFDAEDRPVTRFGPKNFKPVSLAVKGDELYVSDFVGRRVEIFDRHTGQSKGTIGGPGPDDGQFSRPLGIDIDPLGNVVVSDVFKCRVQKLGVDGQVKLAFGTNTDNIGNFVRPKHLAVDREGNIYVVDASFQNVQIFNENGELLTFFGSPGAHPGAMYLPAGISVHEGDLDLFARYIHPDFEAKRLIVVTNQFGPNKVAVYALGQLRAGRTVEDLVASRVVVAEGMTNPEDESPTVLPDLQDQSEAPEAGGPLTAPPAAGESPEPSQ